MSRGRAVLYRLPIEVGIEILNGPQAQRRKRKDLVATSSPCSPRSHPAAAGRQRSTVPTESASQARQRSTGGDPLPITNQPSTRLTLACFELVEKLRAGLSLLALTEYL